MAQTQLTYAIIREGDTLASLAQRYKCTMTRIARLNSLSKDAVLSPGQLLQVPKPPPEPSLKQSLMPRPRTPRYAFAVCTGQEGIYPGSDKALTREGQEGLSGIFPLWFQAAPQDPRRLQAFVSEEQMRKTVEAAQERNVRVLAVLSNQYYAGGVKGRDVSRLVLTSGGEGLIRTLVSTYRQLGLDGILLDWADLDPADLEACVAWVERLGKACRAAELRLVVNVPVLTGRGGVPAPLFPELGRLGRAADFVALLVNTEHRMHTPPGPLASLDWAEAGVKAALERGLQPEKILLGVAGYAYDWKMISEAPEYLSFDGAMNRARQYRVNVQFDADSQTPRYRYRDSNGTEHEVWFENTSSLSQKITLVNRYELAGLTLWRLGVEDPGLWPLLRARWGEIRKWETSFRNLFYDK